MNDAIRLVAIQAVVDMGKDRDNIASAQVEYPRFTSAVSAHFDVVVTMKDESYYTVTVAARVNYSHFVAL